MDYSEKLNEKFGGDWFYNLETQRYEDYLSDRSISVEDCIEKISEGNL